MKWIELVSLLKRKHRACYLKFFSIQQGIEIKSIVEVGVFRGKNAILLRTLFPDAHLYLIDPWNPSEEYLINGGAVSQNPLVYKEAYNRVKSLFKEDPNVTIIKKESLQAIKEVPTPVDLIFLDASHYYPSVKKNIKSWFEKVRLGGILSGHNYGRARLSGVKKAVDELIPNPLYLGQDEVWAHIKKSASL